MKWLKAVLLMMVLGFSINAMALEDEDEMAFKDAVIEGDVKTVEKFVKAEPAVVNAKFFGWTPLQMAAHHNQVKVAEYLVSKGAELNYIQPNARHTAFMLAAFDGHKEMLNYLAKAGADVNVKLKGDVSILRYFKDKGANDWVKVLSDLGVKDDGCQGECF